MSTLRHTPPTRHNLLRVRQRLARVLTATRLLTRKRSALVNELFRTAKPVLDAREASEWQAAVAFSALLGAQADRGPPLLQALALPKREIQVELRLTESWGLPAADVVGNDPVRRTSSERQVAAGSTGPATASAASEFEALTELLLDTASREILIRRLARALAETSRRINLLERRVAPGLTAEATRIEATLEEREREEQLRYRRLMDRPGAGHRFR
ncbi:MAG: V-type ATP synthase subunit D [Deltaproteobacteria bacterium]|nr:V-type ATP synthase subunit D [Deltaproteobacteria bacterium]